MALSPCSRNNPCSRYGIQDISPIERGSRGLKNVGKKKNKRMDGDKTANEKSFNERKTRFPVRSTKRTGQKCSRGFKREQKRAQKKERGREKKKEKGCRRKREKKGCGKAKKKLSGSGLEAGPGRERGRSLRPEVTHMRGRGGATI